MVYAIGTDVSVGVFQARLSNEQPSQLSTLVVGEDGGVNTSSWSDGGVEALNLRLLLVKPGLSMWAQYLPSRLLVECRETSFKRGLNSTSPWGDLV